jgi:hypothetical protein
MTGAFPPSNRENAKMRLSETFRENAANCAELAESASDAPAIARYRRMERAWLDLAVEQDWLDGEVPDKTRIVANCTSSTEQQNN